MYNNFNYQQVNDSSGTLDFIFLLHETLNLEVGYYVKKLKKKI